MNHRSLMRLSFVVAAAMVAIAGAPSASGQSPGGAKLLEKGKAATAMVVVNDGAGSASAFCVDPTGVFVTCRHVVDPPPQHLMVVTHPGTPEAKSFAPLRVVFDRTADVAIIIVREPKELVALPLGATGKLSETDEVTLYGYPFGEQVSLEPGKLPAVTVSKLRISSLRRAANELELIQLDGPINPGNSGGPVVDQKGNVIGIATLTIAGSGVGFAIPIEKAREVLSGPVIQCEPPQSIGPDLSKPVTIAFQLQTPIQKPKPEFLSTVIVRMAGIEPRTINPSRDAEKGSDWYKATFVPRVKSDKPSSVKLKVKFAEGGVVGFGVVPDFRAGSTNISIREVAAIVLGDQPNVVLRDGRTIDGPITGLGRVACTLGGSTISMDLSTSKRIDVTLVDEAPISEVEVAIVIKHGETEINRKEFRLPVILDATVAAAPPQDPVAPEPIPSKAETADASDAAGPGGEDALIPAVTAADLGDKAVERKLPHKISDVILAGAGRYLLLPMNDHRTLAVFDVSKAEVVKYLPLPSVGCVVAGSARKIVIYDNEKFIIQRYNLATFERELSLQSPVMKPVTGMAMGPYGDGPLAAHFGGDRSNGELQLLALATLRPMVLERKEVGFWTGDASRMRASPDGKHFAAWTTNVSPTGISLIWLAGNNLRARYEHNSAGYLQPTDDGRLCTQTGLYRSDLKTVIGERMSTYMSADGRYYLRTVNAGRSTTNPAMITQQLALGIMGESGSLFTLPSFPEMDKPDGFSAGTGGQAVPPDHRVVFIPAAKMLITVPTDETSLVLRRIDIIQKLEQSDVDYLFVDSNPPKSAVRGKPLSYQMTIVSRRGGVKCKLESGPPGMTVSPSGLLTWTAPSAGKGGKPETLNAIVAISDSSDQQQFHTFDLTVDDR